MALTQKLRLMQIIFERVQKFTSPRNLPAFSLPPPPAAAGSPPSPPPPGPSSGKEVTNLQDPEINTFPAYPHPLPRPDSTPPTPHRTVKAHFQSVSLVFTANPKSEDQNI